LKLTEQEVRYVAALANLELSAHEVRRMCEDLGEVLAHMEKLNELDTADIEPMTQVLYDAEETATLRGDRERLGIGQDDAVRNAPAASGGLFKVPKVIER
jgi:aspartyl-tRNA(Asn)/glutamyl-tRNA(Gln) amidotransferase subunit C